MSNQIAKQDEGQSIIERVIIQGDLSQLKPEERVRYYNAVCQSVGLNPLTQPFQYITLNGKLTLYARKDATDQLRNLKGVSITKLEREKMDDIYTVTAYAQDSTGRSDSSVGAVTIGNLRGDALANAIMKAETKAKRRVTLSICGLGMLDETELETIHDATPTQVKVIETETAYEPDQAQDADAEKKTYSRPLSPEDLKHLLEKKAEGYAKKTVNEKQIGLTASMMEWPFAGQQHTDKIRHSITKYLVGYTSLKDTPAPLVHALLDWLKPVQDTGGEYTPDEMAVKEIKSVWTAALKAEGQGELPL